MGRNGPPPDCYDSEKGKLASTGEDVESCCSCDCECDSDTKLPICIPWPYESGDYGAPPGEESAIAQGSASTSENSSVAYRKSSSTYVAAKVYYPGENVYNVSTVGGRQILRLKNGALDLRWQFNQAFDSDWFCRVPTTGTGQFDPAGKSATFGFLYWLKRWGGWNHFLFGNGGIARDMADAATDAPIDVRDQNQFQTQAATYFRYESQTRTYFWYDSENLNDEIPKYVQAIADAHGYSLYYNYDGSKRLLRISGDVGRLTPYFGYDASQHINRVYLQDSQGSDHRSTYYYYNGSGQLTTIVEPLQTVTYFSMVPSAGIGYSIERELDPSGVATYFVYSTGPDKQLLWLQQGGRTTYFSDDGERSASAVANGSQRYYNRFGIYYHGYAATKESIGGSLTAYEYNGANTQISAAIDPRGNQTSYLVNNLHFRTRIAAPDGGVTYYFYDTNDVDIVTKLGPRHSSMPQATYYNYAPGSRGLRTRILNPLAISSYFNYDSLARQTSTLDGRSGATYFYYDQYNQNNVVVDALNNPAYFAYNANGRRTRLQNAIGATTYWNFDSLDQRLSELAPTGDFSYFGYDKRGLMTTMARFGGRAAYYSYDAFRNRTRHARLGTSLITSYFTYDEQNNVVSELDFNGNKTEHGFDFRNKRVRNLDALENSTYFTYDPNGNLVFERDASGDWTRTDYDVMNRVSGRVRGVAGPRASDSANVAAHWNLNETSGSRSDDSGNSNSLSEIASVGSAPGIIRNGASFSAASSSALQASSSSSLNITTDLTLAAWINLGSLPALPGPGQYAVMPLISRWTNPIADGRSYLLCIVRDNGGGIYPGLFISDNGNGYYFYYCFPLIPLNTSEWRHIAASFLSSSGTFTFYVDGVRVFQVDTPLRGIHSSSANLSVGFCDETSFDTITTEYFDGLIDEMYIYNKVLTQAAISQLYQQRVDVSFTADSSNVIATYFGYDLDGNRIRSVDERGFATYFGYDAINRQIQWRDPLGNSEYYRYDANNNRLIIQNPRRFSTYFGYDALNNQARMHDALARTTYYGYDAISNRTRIQYPDNVSMYYGYDGDKRRIRMVDRGGFTSYFGFDSAGNQNRMVDQRSNTTYYRFDLLDRNIGVLDALRQATYYQYDANGNRIRATDHIAGASTATTYFGFDALNRMTRSLDALNRAAYFGYDADGNQVYVAQPGASLRTTYFAYDKFSRVSKTLSPTQDATYYGYDPASNRIRTFNARSFTTYFGYDALNRQSQALDALNGSTYFGYDENGNLIRSRGARGFTTYYAFDALDRLASTRDARNAVTERGYDLAGNLARFKPAVGGSTYFYYEPRNLLSVVLDAANNSIFHGYDAAGNRTITALALDGYGQQPWGSSPYGGITSTTYFGYDALNRLVRVENPEAENTYFGYDIGGNANRTLDPLLRATYFNYDRLDRLASVHDALATSIYFGYDAAGNRAVELDQRQNSTYYSYDLLNRLGAILDPLSIAAYYGYDANSNLVKTLDNNRTAVYFGYDALDRRTAIQYPFENQYFGYDAEGNLLAMSDAWGGSYYVYDQLSRLTQRRTPRADAVYYGYDDASNLLRLQYPQDNLTCYYGYDAAQRMTQLRTPNSNGCYFGYNEASQAATKLFGNSAACYYMYDNALRVTSMRYFTGLSAVVAYFDYGRDSAGRITQMGRDGDLAIYYEYDSINRMVGEYWRRQSDNAQVYAFMYAYDTTNNRLQQRREKTAGSEWDSAYYSYAADNSMTKRRKQIPPGTFVDTYFTYDANGSLLREIEGGSTTYFEYAANQLISKITPPAGSAWEFSYDARLNRYKIDRGGTIRFLLWDGLNCMEERDNSGNLVTRYTYGYSSIYGIGSYVEIYVPGAPNKTYTLIMDHRGTAHVLLDETGAETGRRYYDAFGVIVSQTGSWPVDMGYQTNWQTIQIGNKWWGLSKYRLYDPETGTFISRDFLNYPNKYRAFSNNPVGQVDRDGLADVDPNTSWNQRAWTVSPDPTYTEKLTYPDKLNPYDPQPDPTGTGPGTGYVRVDIVDYDWGLAQRRWKGIRFWLASGNAPDAYWIQFISSEFWGLSAPKGSKPWEYIAATINTTGGSYQATTNPRNRIWSVDSKGNSGNKKFGAVPSYEVDVPALRSPWKLGVWDRPGPQFGPLKKVRDNYCEIYATDHFVTFLVHVKNGVHTVVWGSSWMATSHWKPGDGDGPEPDITSFGGGASLRPDTAQNAAWKARGGPPLK